MAFVVVAHAVPAGQRPKLDQVVARLGTYLADYEQRLALVVAEERHRQSLDIALETGVVNVPREAPVSPVGHQDRVLRSDYALTLAADKAAWVGYRGTFTTPVSGAMSSDCRYRSSATTSASRCS